MRYYRQVRVSSRDVVGTIVAKPVVASRLPVEKDLTFHLLEVVICIQYSDCTFQGGLTNGFRCRLHTRLALPVAELSL